MFQKLPNDMIYNITKFLCVRDSRKIKNILRVKIYTNPKCNIYVFMHQTGLECTCSNSEKNTGLTPWIQFG